MLNGGDHPATTPVFTDSTAAVLAISLSGMHASFHRARVVGARVQQKDQVGTLLLGGKPRTASSVPAKVDRTVASSRTSPRIHIVRLPQPVDVPVTNVTALQSKAS